MQYDEPPSHRPLFPIKQEQASIRSDLLKPEFLIKTEAGDRYVILVSNLPVLS